MNATSDRQVQATATNAHIIPLPRPVPAARGHIVRNRQGQQRRARRSRLHRVGGGS